MGPTQVSKSTASPRRAAGIMLVKTELEPLMIVPGLPGTQPGMMQGNVMLPIMAAGSLLIITFVETAGMIWIGIGGCGIGVGVGAGG